MSLPELWFIAGINGAGKTTFAQKAPIQNLLETIQVQNADDRTLGLLLSRGVDGFATATPQQLVEAFREAADTTESIIRTAIRDGERVGVETVLSTDKYKDILLEARAAGYFIGMIYVVLRSSELAVARVTDRVARGGHDVPADRIRERWRRSLDNLGWFAERVDRLFVFDNSSDAPDTPATLIAEAREGRILITNPDAVPELTQRLLATGATVSPSPR